MSDSDDGPDLNKVIAAAGYQVFSYFPIGGLINGHRSPFLVNTIFHDAVFQCLGQRDSLSLSQCSHLRKINDEQLINLIQTIVEVSEAYHPGYKRRVDRRREHDCSNKSICPCPIKVTHLDLSRCRLLMGEGVHYCLKHMPSVKRVLLSGASRFDAKNHFADHGALRTRQLEYLDVSDCPNLDNMAIKRMITNIQGKNIIRHLDFSGCSESIDDSIAGTVAFCQNLENLNLAGAVNITSFGVGIIAYICRKTLKCLSLRGCVGVNLPKLLMAASDELIDLAGSDEDHRALPPNFEGDHNDRSLYIAALCSVLVQMMRVHDDVGQILHLSQRYMASFKKLAKKWSSIWGSNEMAEADDRMFGQLEVLDLGFVGKDDIRLEGCIATIAWLNGGKLKQIDLEGLKSVSHFDISVLGSTSRENLKRLNASAMTDIPSEHSSCFFFHTMKHISELDLSGYNHWEGSSGVAIVFLDQLISLKLDNTNIKEAILVTVLTKCKKLLNLSVRGCKELTSKKICAAKLVNRKLRLLELDCRNIKLDASLSKIQKVYPTLLRLNNRLTDLGDLSLKFHQSNFAWSVGSRECPLSVKIKKRKRDGTMARGRNNTDTISEPISSSTRNKLCSILSTGFSYSRASEQEMFGCKTCGIDFGNFVCLACCKNCHGSHDVFSVGYGYGCCDCCIFSTCQCLDDE